MSETSEPSDAVRAELEQELARLRAERRTAADDLAGEDPDDTHLSDPCDQSQALEGQDDLARMDQRIREIERLVAGQDPPGDQAGWPDGTLVTLRFPEGDEVTLRVVTIAEQAGEDGQEEVVTLDSPLGRALTGHDAGDTVTYDGPDGELHAELLAVQPPR